uniref:Protein SULFUR DEFICIENCY-INDUCED 1-like n=1 Tax=Nicotiana tabacum TaxID=4097 RepID=A0A1S4A5T8_TOBAC|nr:PREDICTED: protein SULFUR DEFICIENCY-INDUCED 1-like [Nicotiana tabacum]
MEMMKNKENKELFHVVHKVPSGDGPYVRAKHAQLVEKEPEAAIVWFWKAINGGDRVDSALKDMCVVMKQLHRTEEAIEAIHSFRSLCSQQAQESLDNVLLDLLKVSLLNYYILSFSFLPCLRTVKLSPCNPYICHEFEMCKQSLILVLW